MTSSNDLRVLVVSALGRIIEPALQMHFASGRIVVVTDPTHLAATISGAARFDVALIDLNWHQRAHEWHFDGLDAIEVLRRGERAPACICTAQGESQEDDLLAEALDPKSYPEVVAALDKREAPTLLTTVIERAALGLSLDGIGLRPPAQEPALHDYFRTGRGRTAGVLAAAVATGRVGTYGDLARLAAMAPDTANKLTGYLGPLLTARGEVPHEVPITQSVIYRWCGEHARYLLSWARRHVGDGASLTRWPR